MLRLASGLLAMTMTIYCSPLMVSLSNHKGNLVWCPLNIQLLFLGLLHGGFVDIPHIFFLRFLLFNRLLGRLILFRDGLRL
jgi:hypothetical protein